MRWLVLSFALLWTQPVFAQGQFSENWSSVCSIGAKAEAGCDDILAREILDAAMPPWRAIGRINFASRDQKSHCTGVLVSDVQVLTAAHCLYNTPRQRWIPPSSIRFAAGYQRGAAVAVSEVSAYRLASGQDIGRAFANQADLDWAVLELADPIGHEVGFLPLADEETVASFVAGYPGLRPHVLSRTKVCAPRRHADGVLLAICPVMMGDSGAPLLVETPTGLKVAGVLSRVAATPDGITALFLSTEVFDLGTQD